jgi:crossover junction endodeoxyribonuclease RuvC
MRLIGLDPGLRHTGWGVIESVGNRLSFVAAGAVHSDGAAPLADRLVALYDGLAEVLDRMAPAEAAVEETFVNKNASSTLKLGVARGVVLLAPARRGLPVAEYSANAVKKAVVGVGHADKQQVQMMVRRLLPGAELPTADAADALAVAICHAHHRQTKAAWGTLPHAADKPLSYAADPPLNARSARPLSPAGRGQGEGEPPKAASGATGGAIQTRSAGPLSLALPPMGGEDGAVASIDPAVLSRSRDKATSLEIGRAKRLRREQTETERRLWYQLRAHRFAGLKFRRQEPILGFTADFVCHERRLVIELDGSQHGVFTAADERRTAMLSQAGFRVLRFWNGDVADNMEGVLASIAAAVAEPAP